MMVGRGGEGYSKAGWKGYLKAGQGERRVI